MRFAIVQQAGSPGDLRSNVSSICSALQQSVSCGARIVFVSPGALHPKNCDPLFVEGEYARIYQEALNQVAEVLSDTCILILTMLSTTAELVENLVFGNHRCVVIGDHLALIPLHLQFRQTEGVTSDCPGAVAKDHDAVTLTFQPEGCIVDYGGFTCSLHALYNAFDGRVFDGCNTDYIRTIEERLASQHSQLHIELAAVGAYDRDIFLGSSLLFQSQSLVYACEPLFEGVLVFEAVDKEHLQVVSRCQKASQSSVAPAKSSTLCNQGTLESMSNSFNPQVTFLSLSYALASYVTNNGFSDVVLGLSGGMDSALVATLAVHALGKDSVHALILPGDYTTEQSLIDAYDLIERLGIEALELPIETMCKEVFQSVGVKPATLTEQNVQARIRGLLIMTYSNKLGYLVLNTSNKSEAALGYSTLYGDTIGGFAPLADLYKTQVYRVAHAASFFFEGNNPIPQSIFDKAPSAELAPDQTDEQSLGLSYELLDQILETYLRLKTIDIKGVSERVCCPEDIVARVIRSFHAHRFKREQEPFGPTVSSTPLVSTRVWPLSCTWNTTQQTTE